MPRFHDPREPEVSKWRTYNFFPGDVISLNFGFGCKDTGTITYINPSHTKIVINHVGIYGVEEPWISQVTFLEKSPERKPEMKLNWKERLALWLLDRTGFFNKTGHEQVVEGMRLYTYRVLS